MFLYLVLRLMCLHKHSHLEKPARLLKWKLMFLVYVYLAISSSWLQKRRQRSLRIHLWHAISKNGLLLKRTTLVSPGAKTGCNSERHYSNIPHSLRDIKRASEITLAAYARHVHPQKFCLLLEVACSFHLYDLTSHAALSSLFVSSCFSLITPRCISENYIKRSSHRRI